MKKLVFIILIFPLTTVMGQVTTTPEGYVKIGEKPPETTMADNDTIFFNKVADPITRGISLGDFKLLLPAGTTYTEGNGINIVSEVISVENSEINPEWDNVTGKPINLDIDSTDDFSGDYADLTGKPVNIDEDSTDDSTLAPITQTDFDLLPSTDQDEKDWAFVEEEGAGTLSPMYKSDYDSDDDGQVDAIDDGTVTTPKIASGAVTSTGLASNSVTNAKMADNAVNTAELANNAVTTAKIADGQVGNADLAANAVTTGKVQDGTLQAVDMSSTFYLEGTFTPTIFADTSDTYSFITGGPVGEYVKVGNQITVYIELHNLTGSGTGFLRIGNMPFLPSNEFKFASYVAGVNQNFYSTVASIQVATGYVGIYAQTSLDGAIDEGLEDITFSNASIVISGTYIID